jgi:polysaccharide pyruvyl transferase WcaK-like protein
MAHRGEVEIVESAAEHGALQALLGGLDLVVSTRLHGLIFAANAGVPGIGINLNTKVRAFLCDLGLSELAVSPWDGRGAALPELIDRVLEHKEEYANRLAAGMAAQRQAAARNPAMSAELLAARRERG